jgi:hypothetical protein
VFSAVRSWTGNCYGDVLAYPSQPSLTDDEREVIVLAVKSVFSRLRKLYKEITPIFLEYGFTPPSAGVMARDLSERIEKSIVQHCDSFTRGRKFCDLSRAGRDWEVKIAKHSGLTINSVKPIDGETFIVVNYTDDITVGKVWVLWNAHDELFSPKRPRSQARALLMAAAASHIDTLFAAKSKKATLAAVSKARPAKVLLAARAKKDTA